MLFPLGEWLLCCGRSQREAEVIVQKSVAPFETGSLFFSGFIGWLYMFGFLSFYLIYSTIAQLRFSPHEKIKNDETFVQEAQALQRPVVLNAFLEGFGHNRLV